jgi:diacylglycerol kinase family enzyme
MRFAGVLNRGGGTLRTMDADAFCVRAREILAEHGHTIDFRVVSGETLLDELNRAAGRSDIDALVAGGGDGTVSAAAAAAFRTGIPLAVLPAGTMNLFARALGLPLDLEGALHAIGESPVRAVDIATANGRPFVHQYSVGIHTRLVRLREGMSYRSRFGKMLASAQAMLLATSKPPEFEAEIRSPRGLEQRRCSTIVVSNNPFGQGHLPHPDSLDTGVLGVYITGPISSRELIRLTADVVLGNWKASPLISEREVSEVTLIFPRKTSSALATIDGELIPLDKRVDVLIHPRALMVVAPAAA